MLQFFYDLEKEWKVDKTDRYEKEDALMITGHNIEKGTWAIILLIAKNEADKDTEIYKEYEDVR